MNHTLCAVLVLACPGVAVASVPLASCGFEPPAYHLGVLDQQGSWLAFPGDMAGAVDVVTTPRKSGVQGMLMNQSVTFDSLEAVWPCNATLSSGTDLLSVEWDMRIELGNGSGWTITLTAANGAPLGMLWVDGGNLWYKVWSFDPQAGNGFLNAGTWGHFRVDLDWSARTTTFMLGSTVIGTQGWHHAPSRGVAQVALRSLIGGTTDKAAFDNFLVSETPPPCPADFDGSGFVDTDDFDAFVVAFEQGFIEADFDASGFVDTDDFDAFVRAFEAGC